MTYEDTIRVADAEDARRAASSACAAKCGWTTSQLLAINEFLHPRLQEICDTLPAGLGRWLERSGWPRRLVERLTQQGPRRRHQLAARLPAALALSPACAAGAAARRAIAAENAAHRGLAGADRRPAAGDNPRSRVEIARCQRLVKGYSDTHERGVRNFESDGRRPAAGPGHARAAATLRELRDAALADEHGASCTRRWRGTRSPEHEPKQEPCAMNRYLGPTDDPKADPARWCSPTACTATSTSSPEIFALEQEHFFANTWNYVGHGSQMPQAGRLPASETRQPAADRRAPRRRLGARADEPLRAQGLAAGQRRPAATPASSSAARTTPGPSAPTARC